MLPINGEAVFRPMRDADAPHVVAVLRDNYGDDYFHVQCYDPVYLTRANHDGTRLTFVAEMPGVSGVAGIVSGFYRGYLPGSYELGMHAVRRDCQGRGIGRALLAYCVSQMCRMRIHGLYGMPVTMHHHSQLECESIGLTATGFWMGRYRAERTFIEKKFRSPKLHSLVVARKGGVSGELTLHVPERFHPFVHIIYNALQTPCQFVSDGACDWERSSIFLRETADAHNKDIFVRSVGADLLERMDDIVRGFVPIDGCTVFLNMLDPCGACACESLLDRGFFFTGLHPLHNGCEYIMLHRACEGGYDWSELQLTETNARLLDEILRSK